MNRKKIWKILQYGILCIVILGVLGVCSVFGINSHVKHRAKPYLLTQEAAASVDADCILVLGCGVRDNGEPSDMLKDRLERGIALYKAGAAPKILMSGDHGQVDYDEVNTMKQYAISAGIPSEDIFMDHAGFSTYESMYRAKDIFQAETIIVVTQQYHLYRAVYIAQQFDMEAYGVSSDYDTYAGQIVRDLREVLARVKDFGTALLKPEPTFRGTAIPINGNGDLTND